MAAIGPVAAVPRPSLQHRHARRQHLGAKTMRVVAATFADEAAARRALAELRERYELRPVDAEVAPLGTAGQETGGQVVLAGRFNESVVPDVERLIEGRGGAIVAEVDEEKAEHPAHDVADPSEPDSAAWAH